MFYFIVTFVLSNCEGLKMEIQDKYKHVVHMQMRSMLSNHGPPTTASTAADAGPLASRNLLKF